MSFADPGVCPACEGALDGSSTCPSCGLDLTSPEVVDLWQTLLRADALVERAIQIRDAKLATPAPAPEPHKTPPASEAPPPVAPPQASAPAAPAQPLPTLQPPVFTPSPTLPPLQQAQPRERSWTVGTILLALGAFGLVVAALIFVSRSWDTIGLVGKSLIMLGATLIVAEAAVWVTKRPLRASAEALWAVLLIMVGVDFAGARGEGLFGLDAIDWSWTWIAIGLTVTAVSAAVLMWSRRPIGHELWTPGFGAVTGLAVAAGGTAGVVDATVFWRFFAGLIVAGVLGLVLRFTESKRIAIGARVVVAVMMVVAAIAALAELVANPAIDQVVGEAHGVPMVLTTLAALVIGYAVPVARVAMAAVAFLGLFALVAVPWTTETPPEGAFLGLATFAAVPAVLLLKGDNQWIRGFRIGVVAPTIGLLGLAAWWIGNLLVVLGKALDNSWAYQATVRIFDTEVADNVPWAICIAGVALLVALVSIARWPGVLDGSATGSAVVVGTFCLITAVVTAMLPPWWAAAGLYVLVGAGAAAVHRMRPTEQVWPIGALVAVATGCWLATGSQGASALVWAVSAAVLALLVAVGRPWVGWTAGGPIAPLAAGAAAATAEALGASDFGAAAAAVAVATVIAVACALGAAKLPDTFTVVEAGAGVALLVALVGAEGGGRAAALWTAVGVAACVVAATTERRRWYVVPGVLALVVAYILLIVDSGFSFVEAYTLPIGVALLAAGLWWMRTRPSTNSWAALGAGLSVALLPSVPQALADPTGLRALLLGGAAVAILAVGVKLDWQAPFIFGCVIAALVLLFNIGPYANAAPRVAVIAAVSVVLVAVGITWEDRVRDGRRVMAFVKAMK